MFDWLSESFMLQALVACAAMGVLLAYLGIHVVGRGIVFVDLGLGQISSLGVAYAGWSGRDPVVCSMAFTLVGAALFSVLRVRDPRLRLEAIIGIFYAVSSAATVLLIAKTPHGDADIQDVLFGNVLALDAAEVRRMLVVFGLVALFQGVLSRSFFSLTYSHGHGSELSRRDHVLNLLFYVSLAFAIVFAIRAGGVIPVFAFLIVPPVAAVLLSRRTSVVTVLAILVALASSFLGVHFSYVYDLPAGASIVAVLGAFVLLAAVAGSVTSAVRGDRGSKAGVAALLLVAALASPASAVEQEAAAPPATGELAHLLEEVALLKEQLALSGKRIEKLEADLALLASAPPPPPAAPATPTTTTPAAPAAGGLKLIDISVDGLFAAGASSAREEELRGLKLGGHDPKSRGVTLQNLELTLAGAVDPYVRGDANVVLQIDEEGETVVEVEEAYLTTLGLPADLQLVAGTFLSRFGRLNLQHPHAWDFADQPVVSSRLLGPDGLRGPGAELAWLLPTPFFAEAMLGIQDSQGETAFSFRSVPGEELFGRTLIERDVRSASDLLWSGRLATSFDLSDSFTLVTGASHVAGPNATGTESSTSISGLDLYAKWKPLANDHGWPFFTFQAEGMARRYEAGAQEVDGVVLPDETFRDRGLYAQSTWGFTRRWVVGVRYDWAGASDPSLAEAGLPLDPLRDERRRMSAALTFYPSEFSKLRLQYDRDVADHLDEGRASSLFLQFEFVYGAHGGHKF